MGFPNGDGKLYTQAGWDLVMDIGEMSIKNQNHSCQKTNGASQFSEEIKKYQLAAGFLVADIRDRFDRKRIIKS